MNVKTQAAEPKQTDAPESSEVIEVTGEMGEAEIGVLFEEPEDGEEPEPQTAEQDEPEAEEAEPEAEEAEPDDEDAEYEEGDAEEGDEEQDAQNAPAGGGLEPPAYFDAEAKERFAKLPKEAQEVVLDHEKQREAFVNRKSQELSAKMRETEGLSALGNLLQNDPGFREYIKQYNAQQAQKQEPNQQNQPPTDPWERMQWEAKEAAKREIMAEIGPQIQQLQGNTEEAAHVARINAAKAEISQDPLYAETHKAIGEHVQQVMEVYGKEEAQRLYQRLDSDPDYYKQVYTTLRKNVESAAAKNDGQPSSRNPVKRRTERAPKLEGGGADDGGNKMRVREKRKELKKRISSTITPDPKDIGEYFDLLGG